MGYAGRIRRGHAGLAVGDRRRFGFARRLWLTLSVVCVDAWRGLLRLLEAPFIWAARQLPATLGHKVWTSYDVHYGRRWK